MIWEGGRGRRWREIWLGFGEGGGWIGKNFHKVDRDSLESRLRTKLFLDYFRTEHVLSFYSFIHTIVKDTMRLTVKKSAFRFVAPYRNTFYSQNCFSFFAKA